ncbi:sugar ABC transporter ATP-binding protein [Saccharospirillum mangrovi]|uniref:sugar ABC transporter ATP-binding protein n=1 Tax=Saccharospirillum mangrovi TaxID=2161747 RepID=UPI000D396002|nr:sugar ABC transporter ATP-binding protein [Saccharospirillum mangrovi]
MTTVDETVLELIGIEKAFGATHALRGVDFNLRKGEIHALVGENGAGKSTLMKIIDGIHQPDAGEIKVHGQTTEIADPLTAQKLGIGLVHQEIALCPDVTVAENISMPMLNASKRWFVNFREIRRIAREAIKPLADIDPDARLHELSISNQQLVEIAKALTLNCNILIFDEPTAALTESESKALFRIMQELKAKGISIIYISHRMAEIFSQCDRITVLRDGQFVCTENIADTTPDAIVGKMVGRDLGELYPPKLSTPPEVGEVLLEVKNLSDERRFHDIHFRVHRGEIFGIAGLIGAGRSEVVKAICGLHKRTSGELTFLRERAEIRNYQDSVALGIVYLSEDRKENGVFLDLSIAGNIAALDLDQVSRYGFVNRRLEREQAKELAQRLNLKYGRLDHPVSSLSGGNQQKVAIAKMLSVKPRLVIMDEPTRGIDVGAKSEIHRLIRELASQGVGVIVISSELPEVVGLCDRVMVMCEGRSNGIVSGDAINEDRIIRLASGLGQSVEKTSADTVQSFSAQPAT